MTESEFNQRQAVLTEAVSWLRTPFHHRACVKGAGVDCIHFIYASFRETGLVPEIEFEEYPLDWHVHRDEERILKWILKFARPVEPPYKPGDVAMWRFGRCLSHVAIVVEWPTIIHAFSGSSRVTYDDAEMNNQLIYAGRTQKASKRVREVFRYHAWE
jgi:cell wall-associated NlpC family hydrolase